MIKIALLGYGKMGQMIERLATEQGDQILLKLDEDSNRNFKGINAENFNDIDVAIDFSAPQAVVENTKRIAALGRNVVIGTTGWLSELPTVRQLAETEDVGILWSPNFSIGVNVFFRLVNEAARLLRNQPGYEAWGYEIHHSAKLDAPSGTLIKLVEEMQHAGFSGKIDVSSNRAGSHPGTHEIGFDSAADTITLKHVARSREGFAQGALVAARWLAGKKGFFEFGDVLFAEDTNGA
ncbi:MAG TPA: dihydrodipicolinate reductase C-terminal domain-containing protein [Fimbriimonadaceae bacterium]|jgi:4-hydroxy-tetrahydrodipicolinate reductase